MSRNLPQLGTSKKDALKKLQNALEARFTKLKVSSFLANDVMYSLTHGENMVCIGGDDSFEAVEDLGNILEKLPSITSEDRASVAGLLNSINFTEIEPRLQAAVREEITNFLNGRSPTLAPIPEEKVTPLDFITAERSSSSAERKSASHNPKPIAENKGAKSGTSLLTNNFAQLLERIGKDKTNLTSVRFAHFVADGVAKPDLQFLIF